MAVICSALVDAEVEESGKLSAVKDLTDSEPSRGMSRRAEHQ